VGLGKFKEMNKLLVTYLRLFESKFE